MELIFDGNGLIGQVADCVRLVDADFDTNIGGRQGICQRFIFQKRRTEVIELFTSRNLHQLGIFVVDADLLRVQDIAHNDILHFVGVNGNTLIDGRLMRHSGNVRRIIRGFRLPDSLLFNRHINFRAKIEENAGRGFIVQRGSHIDLPLLLIHPRILRRRVCTRYIVVCEILAGRDICGSILADKAGSTVILVDIRSAQSNLIVALCADGGALNDVFRDNISRNQVLLDLNDPVSCSRTGLVHPRVPDFQSA